MKKRSIDGDMVYRAAIVIGNNDGNRFSSFVYAEVAKEALEAALNLPEPEIAVSEKMIDAAMDIFYHETKLSPLERSLVNVNKTRTNIGSYFRAMRRVQIEEERASLAEQERFNHPREISGSSHHILENTSQLHQRRTDNPALKLHFHERKTIRGTHSQYHRRPGDGEQSQMDDPHARWTPHRRKTDK